VADRVALIDYGAGNLHSVHNALKAAGAGNVAVTDDPATVSAADRIVMPGVGAFAACMNGLSAIPGMIDALEDRVQGDKVPFLGICVGMQLLAEPGEEHGQHQGLGWVRGAVKRLAPTEPAAKVPHMGWNQVRWTRAHPVLVGLEAAQSRWFYFVHSYYPQPSLASDTLAEADYGLTFTCAMARDNIVATQFHPEKSAAAGLKLIENFLSWMP